MQPDAFHHFVFYMYLLVHLYCMCWTAAYVLMIRRAWLDKCYAMPPLSVAMDLGWEVVYGFILVHPVPQGYYNKLWFVMSAVMAIQYVLYARNEPNTTYPKKLYAASFCASLLIGFAFMYLYRYQMAAISYLHICIMTILLMSMVIRRNNVQGQSLYIALLRMLGSFIGVLSVLYNVWLGWIHHPPLTYFLFALAFVLDTAYCVMVYKKCKTLSIGPWRRI